MNTLKTWGTLLLVVFSICCSSCIQAPPSPEPIKPANPSVGETLFLNGNYERALEEYSNNYETALAPEDRSHALFGLACTQLTLAHSESQLAEAITTLEKWDAEKVDPQPIENSHLLVIALKTLSEHIQKKNQEQVQLAKRKNTIIANQNKKIAQLGNTVENIQKQLDQLEEIDETLQEKKKSL
ncbi:MAG: hypothetical protein V2B20_00435 [Pseudomonadota bacterium]